MFAWVVPVEREDIQGSLFECDMIVFLDDPKNPT